MDGKIMGNHRLVFTLVMLMNYEVHTRYTGLVITLVFLFGSVREDMQSDEPTLADS